MNLHKSNLNSGGKMVKSKGCLLFIFALLSVLGGCSSGDNIVGSGEMVTISGVAINLDTFQPAKGVEVYLLDHRADYHSQATGADGVFEISLPVGTKFLLVTDDPQDST